MQCEMVFGGCWYYVMCIHGISISIYLFKQDKALNRKQLQRV